MSKGVFLYSKGNVCDADDEWGARHLIIDNIEGSDQLNDELVDFVCDTANLGLPTDDILGRFADYIVGKMRNEGYVLTTSSNSWIYLAKSDCEHCKNRGDGYERGFLCRERVFPKCKIYSRRVDCDGEMYCEYMAEKQRAVKR